MRNIQINYDIGRNIDKILKIAGCHIRVKYNLYENYFNPDEYRRKAGFYNASTGEVVQLKLNQTHSDDEFQYTYNDFDNGWTRYGIMPMANGVSVYISYTKREYANQCIKFIEKIYPNLQIVKYELEHLLGPNQDSILITLDADKKPIYESAHTKMKTYKILKDNGYINDVGEFIGLNDLL